MNEEKEDLLVSLVCRVSQDRLDQQDPLDRLAREVNKVKLVLSVNLVCPELMVYVASKDQEGPRDQLDSQVNPGPSVSEDHWVRLVHQANADRVVPWASRDCKVNKDYQVNQGETVQLELLAKEGLLDQKVHVVLSASKVLRAKEDHQGSQASGDLPVAMGNKEKQDHQDQQDLQDHRVQEDL